MQLPHGPRARILAALGATLAAAVAAAPAHAAAPTFGSATTYPVGAANGVTYADVTHDGKGDLVVAQRASSGAVAVLAGDGSGAFGGAVSTGTGDAYAEQVGAGDFDGDGFTDVAASNWDNDTASVLMNSAGGLTAGTIYPGSTANSVGVAVDDFNGDGKDDFALASDSGNNGYLEVYRRSGSSFTLVGDPLDGYTVALGAGYRPRDIAAADLNKDGKVDLVTADWQQRAVDVLLGNGDGTFALTHVATAGANASIVVDDVDLDGNLDLVVGGNTSEVLVLKGNGAGGFGNGVFYDTGGSQIADVDAADFNGDGYPEIVATNFGEQAIGVLPNNGDGTFGTAAVTQLGTNGISFTTGVVADDFNGDGKPDLAVTSNNGGWVKVLANTTAFPAGVTTGAATDITQTGATLAGTVTPGDADAQYKVEYGTTTAYGSSTTPQALTAKSGTKNVTVVLSGLTAGTTYHYRVVATDDSGTVSGADRTFTTAAATATPTTDTGTGTRVDVAPTGTTGQTGQTGQKPAGSTPVSVPVGTDPVVLKSDATELAGAAVTAAAKTDIGRMLSTGGFTSSFVAAGPCKVTVDALGGGGTRSAVAAAATVVAHGVKSVTKAGKVQVKVKLTKKGRALLRYAKRLKLTMRTTIVDAAGHKVVATKSVTLKKKKKKKK